MDKHPVSQAVEVEEVALSPFFGTAQDMMVKYCRCDQCGAYLHFTHITDFVRNLTQETARCLECGQKSRRVVHRLQ